MKRDMDLIRKILLKIGEYNGDDALQDIQIEGYTPEEIAYHVYLLENAGLIEGKVLFCIDSVKPSGYAIFRLNWNGQEFLDACRNEGIWVKAKEKLKSIGGDAPIEVFKALIIEIMKKQLGM